LREDNQTRAWGCVLPSNVCRAVGEDAAANLIGASTVSRVLETDNDDTFIILGPRMSYYFRPELLTPRHAHSKN
jgi:hypothetical protein